MQTQKPFKLLMVASMFEGSGNTFHRHLDSHPHLYTFLSESQIGTPLSKNLLTDHLGWRYAYSVIADDWTPEEIYEKIGDEEVKTLLRIPNRSKFKNAGVIMDEVTRKALFVRYFNETEGTKRVKAITAYFKSTFDAWENYRRSGQETHYVGYNPSMLLDADKFFDDFPSATMIYVMRNPFSGYSDTLKRPYTWSIQKYCDVWNLCQLKATTLEVRYKNFHIIKNEDYVKDPEKVIGDLLESIGIPSSPTLAYPSFNGKKLDNLMPWGAVEHPSEEYNEKKAGELSKDDFIWINAECKAMLEYWQYDQYAFKLYKKYYEGIEG